MLSILADYNEDVKQYDTEMSTSKILNGYSNLKKNPDNALSDFISADEYFLEQSLICSKKICRMQKKVWIF